MEKTSNMGLVSRLSICVCENTNYKIEENSPPGAPSTDGENPKQMGQFRETDSAASHTRERWGLLRPGGLARTGGEVWSPRRI